MDRVEYSSSLPRDFSRSDREPRLIVRRCGMVKDYPITVGQKGIMSEGEGSPATPLWDGARVVGRGDGGVVWAAG